jgi:hypothetical protein
VLAEEPQVSVRKTSPAVYKTIDNNANAHARLRPSAEDLLKLKLFKHASREALVTKYLDKIPSVCESFLCMCSFH